MTIFAVINPTTNTIVAVMDNHDEAWEVLRKNPSGCYIAYNQNEPVAKATVRAKNYNDFAFEIAEVLGF